MSISLTRSTYTQAPSRQVGVRVGTLPSGKEKVITPSDDLDSFDSYWNDVDKDADKFQVKTLELNAERREELKATAKRSLAQVTGDAVGGVSGVMLSLVNEDIDQAKTMTFEVPKEGAKPQRSPEVWLLADKQN